MKEIISVLLLIALMSCTNKSEDEKEGKMEVNAYSNPNFSKYWDQGKAELTSYDLIQSRYGENRNGEAVLIFVTEDFSKTKHVKLDDVSKAGDDAQHILKLNFTKKFITGIYPYSMMASVFYPLNGEGDVMKISATSQEWCGNTFTQINKDGNGYTAKLFSYFEKEGDHTEQIAANVMTEDGIWNLIRIAPEKLPQGEVNMLPGVLFQRLSHQPLTAAQATCQTVTIANSIYKFSTDDSVKQYVINYASLNRILQIHFRRNFPYEILGWSETYPGLDGKMSITTASMRKQIMLDYWKHHSNADSSLRDSLQVKY